MSKNAVPDQDTVHPEFTIDPDLSQHKPQTGMFPETMDPHQRITLYDDIDIDINWIAESHARAYQRLLWCKSELRRREKKIIDLSNEVAELKGTPKVTLPKLPFLDPPEMIQDLIIIGDRSAQRWIRFLVINFIILIVGFFIGVTLFLCFGVR